MICHVLSRSFFEGQRCSFMHMVDARKFPNKFLDGQFGSLCVVMGHGGCFSGSFGHWTMAIGSVAHWTVDHGRRYQSLESRINECRGSLVRSCGSQSFRTLHFDSMCDFGLIQCDPVSPVDLCAMFLLVETEFTRRGPSSARA